MARFTPDFFAEKITKWRWLIYPWAVTEDISAFLREMDPATQTPEAVRRRLEQEHGIRLSQQQLTDILAMMDHQLLRPRH